jgi:trehalose 6-phosphate phosphatase
MFPRPLLPPPPLRGTDEALLLDFDGTLVELADHPDAIAVDDTLTSLIARLRGTFAGRLALVTGRSAVQIDRFLGRTLDGVALVSSHGAELKVGSHIVVPERPAALLAAEQALRDAFADVEGVVIEVKSLGVAVHYRMAPEVEPHARAVIDRHAGGEGLAIQEGKMMMELRAGGYDKGTGIAALMALPPFAGHRPIFVGDDVTDEAGFGVAAQLGGYGVLVGAQRATAARYRLDSVDAVHAWLAAA